MKNEIEWVIPRPPKEMKIIDSTKTLFFSLYNIKSLYSHFDSYNPNATLEWVIVKINTRMAL